MTIRIRGLQCSLAMLIQRDAALSVKLSDSRQCSVDDSQSNILAGVLTKVDTLREMEEIDEWLPYVRNQKEPLLHGYFVSA